MRETQGPVNVSGFSLGGSRAVMAAQRLDVVGLELIDPVQLRGPIYVPKYVPATVYRASYPSMIHSSPVFGHQQELFVPGRHLQVPSVYRW